MYDFLDLMFTNNRIITSGPVFFSGYFVYDFLDLMFTNNPIITWEPVIFQGILCMIS